MKKALAALLASFVGLFGYQIVDKAIEARVSNLESSVSSLVDVVKSQEDKIDSFNYNTTSGIEDLTNSAVNPHSSTSSSTENSTNKEVYVGYSFPARNLQTKYMFRLYSNGAIRYISTGYGNKPVATTTSNTTLPDFYYEFFLNLTSVEVKVTSIEDKSESFTYYDSDYTLQTHITNKKLVYVTVNISGQTNPAFAGKKVSAYPYIYINEYDDSLSYIIEPESVINEDGSFEISSVYIGGFFNIGENSCYSLFDVRIS